MDNGTYNNVNISYNYFITNDSSGMYVPSSGTLSNFTVQYNCYIDNALCGIDANNRTFTINGCYFEGNGTRICDSTNVTNVNESWYCQICGLSLTCDIYLLDTLICNGDTLAVTGNVSGCTGPCSCSWGGTGSAYLSSTTSCTTSFFGAPNGTYSLILYAVDSLGCGCSDTVTIVVGGLLVIDSCKANPNPMCGMLQLHNVLFLFLEVLSPPYSYQWSGNGSFSPSPFVQNPVFNPSAIGILPITVIATSADGCADTCTFNLTVYPGFNISSCYASPDPVCEDETTTCYVNVGGGTPPYTYSWDDGGTGGTFIPSNTDENPSYVPSGEGYVTIRVVVTDANGCDDTCSFELTVWDAPVISDCYANPDPVCEDEGTVFDVVYSGGTAPFTIGWYNGVPDGTPDWTGDPVNIPPYTFAPGVYTIYVVVIDVNGCDDTCNFSLTVWDVPDAIISPQDTTICLCDTILLDAIVTGGTSPFTYAWYDEYPPVAPPIANTEDIYVSPTSFTTYTFIVTDVNGCDDTTIATVDVIIPTITITEPGAGDTLVYNDTFTIEWTTTDGQCVDSVMIEWSSDNGGSWNTIISSTYDDGMYDWVVPFAYTDSAKIRITEAGCPAVTDTSERFVIFPRRYEITEPDCGDQWGANTTRLITWTSEGYPGGNVRLEWLRGPSYSWALIVNSTPNDGEYAWTVANVLSNTVLIRITDVDFPLVRYTMPCYFSIVRDRGRPAPIFATSFIGIRIVPNPARDISYIAYQIDETIFDKAKLEIFDLTGKLVFEKEQEVFFDQGFVWTLFEWDGIDKMLNRVNDGVFFVRVIQGDKVYKSRLIRFQ